MQRTAEITVGYSLMVGLGCRTGIPGGPEQSHVSETA